MSSKGNKAGWREVKLGDVCTLQRGYDLPKSKMTGGTIPVAGSNGIIGWHNTPSNKNIGVTIGRSGNIGNAFIYKQDFWAHNTTLFVKDFRGNSEVFVYYFLKTFDFTQFNAGSAVPTLNRNHIHQIKTSIPPLPEQKAIAEILTSLDAKIDLLHRQDKTLETLAETLFRQWFVEEAKESWEEKPLSEVADFLNGLACQKHPPENDNEKLPVLKIKELRNGITPDSDYCTSSIPSAYIIERGDIIFSWSASLLVKIWDGEACVLNQHLFKVSSQNYPKWFYYLWCKHHLSEFISISESKTTTMGHIKRSDLDNSTALCPPNTELAQMTETMHPLTEKIIHNSKSIQNLVQLRNTLLPKLVSGEISIVKDRL